MFRSLFKLVIILVLGILIYNFFLGNDSEKQGAKKIFGELKDVGVAVGDLLKTEKQKYDAGKYDKAVDKIGSMLDDLKRNAKDLDEKYMSRIERLDDKREALREDISDLQRDEEATPGPTAKDTPAEAAEKEKIKLQLEDLLKQTESLIQDMEQAQ